MSRTVTKNGQVFHEWYSKGGSTVFMTDSGQVFREDAQGNMVPEPSEESESAESGAVQESASVNEASQAERIQRKFANKDSYAALGFSDQEAQAAAGLDRARGPEAAYLEMGFSKEEARAAAEIAGSER